MKLRLSCLDDRWSLPRYAALIIGLQLAGCASYEHLKGQAQLKLDHDVEGVNSLEKATKLAPTDAEYKIDYLLRREGSVRDVLAAADDLRADGKVEDAKAAYEKALKIDRGNLRARAALAVIPQDLRHAKLLSDGEVLLGQGKVDVALDRANQVLEEYPQSRRAARLREAALDASAAKELEKTRAAPAKSILEKPVTLQFNDAPLRQVFESLSKSVGLNVLIDRDVRPTAKATIFVKDIAVGDAIDFILMQNQMERRAVNANTLLVYPSNDAKKAEYEDLSIRTFQVTNVDIRYLSTMLKTMLKLKDVAADERSGILVIRDTPERLRLAARLIAVHDVPDPEIMLEVEILEVTSSRQSNLGLLPPTSITVSTPGNQGALTLGALKQLRSNDLLVSPISATLNFKLEDADAKLLASPRIRARNREKAKIMIGDRVPTITNTVTPLTTGSSVVTGNVSYQDVGLKLEFEPSVYANNEVGIKVLLEVSNIAAEFTDLQGGRSYQIGTRNASTNLRLREGETQILGGLISDDDRNTASKIPGLGHLPVVGRLFGNSQGSESRNEIILAITPRIIRNLPAQTTDSRGIFSGTANVLRERPILAEPISGLRVGVQVESQRGAVVPAGSSSAIPAAPAGLPAPQALGEVLFNPASPAAATSDPSAPLPSPPPMYVRPPAAK